MNYRRNTYNKNYIMVDIRDILALNDLEQITKTTFSITHDIYLAWIELSQKYNNNLSTFDIAFERNSLLKQYLTKREYIKKESDIYIYLYDDKSFKEIELTSQTKRKIKTK